MRHRAGGAVPPSRRQQWSAARGLDRSGSYLLIAVDFWTKQSRPVRDAPVKHGVHKIAMREFPKTREWHNVDRETFQAEIAPLRKPAVLRGLAADWPAVR